MNEMVLPALEPDRVLKAWKLEAFDRASPKGQPPPYENPDPPDERSAFAVNNGFAYRLNVLDAADYRANVCRWNAGCELQLLEFHDADVGSGGAVHSNGAIWSPNPLFMEPVFEPIQIELDQAISLRGYASNSYSHGIIEVISRVLIAEELDSAIPILADVETPYIRQVLRAIGISIARCTPKLGAKVKRLYVPTFTPWHFISEPPREPILELRERARRQFGTLHDPTPKRVLIVARPRAYRDASNWGDVIRALDAKGYRVDIVNPGDYTVPHQAKLFARSEFVLAAQGSGTTSCLWASEKLKLILIHTPYNPAWSVDYHLASVCGQAFYSLYTDDERRIDLEWLNQCL